MSGAEITLGTVPLPAGDQVTMSPIPAALQAGVPAKMGIDEAGRGSVLGPMPYAGAVWACGCEQLEMEDWDDSKALTLQKRNDLATKFTKLGNVAWVVHPISAAAISTAMLAKEGSRQSLNVLAWNATVGIVKRVISAGVNLQELYVDTVGDPARYQAFLQQQLGPDLRIVVEKKADAKFPIVGAASILAKVTRDGSMLRAEAAGRASVDTPVQTALGSSIPAQQSEPPECSTPAPPDCSPASCSSGTKRTREGEAKPGDESWAMGSGYPSDPATKAWLSKHVHHVFGWGELVRFSWSTASDMFAASSQVAWEWEDDESPKGGQGMAALSRLWRKTDLPAVMLDAGMSAACDSLLG